MQKEVFDIRKALVSSKVSSETFEMRLLLKLMTVCVYVCVHVHRSMWTTGRTGNLIVFIHHIVVGSPLSHVRLFATLWTGAHQAPLAMGFPRQEYWSGLPFPSPRDLPDLGIKPMSPALQTDSLLSEPPGTPNLP